MATQPRVPCVACRAMIRQGSIHCDVCGAPQRELPPCPHCRGKGSVKVDSELRLVCNLCGGPRIPELPDDLETSGAEAGLLVQAEKLRKLRGLWRAGALVAGLSLPFIALFAMLLGLVWSWAVAATIALVVGGPIAAGAAFAMRRNKERTSEIASLVERAWVSAATDITEAKGGKVSAKELAKVLGVDRARAEQLLAMVSVDSELAGSGLRITVPPDERFEELEAKAEAKEKASAGEGQESTKAKAKTELGDGPVEDAASPSSTSRLATSTEDDAAMEEAAAEEAAAAEVETDREAAEATVGGKVER